MEGKQFWKTYRNDLTFMFPSILWIDVETNGLEITDSLILEIALVYENLKTGETFTFNRVVSHLPPDYYDEFVTLDQLAKKLKLSDWCVNQFKKNGLLLELFVVCNDEETRENSCTKRVEQEIICWLKEIFRKQIEQYISEKGAPEHNNCNRRAVDHRTLFAEHKFIIGGKNIYFDAAVLKQNMPILYSLFNYYYFDIAPFEALKRWRGEPNEFKTTAASHRALADVQQTMLNFRAIQETMILPKFKI